MSLREGKISWYLHNLYKFDYCVNAVTIYRYDTRSSFKQSEAELNSVFTFS